MARIGLDGRKGLRVPRSGDFDLGTSIALTLAQASGSLASGIVSHWTSVVPENSQRLHVHKNNARCATRPTPVLSHGKSKPMPSGRRRRQWSSAFPRRLPAVRLRKQRSRGPAPPSGALPLPRSPIASLQPSGQSGHNGTGRGQGGERGRSAMCLRRFCISCGRRPHACAKRQEVVQGVLVNRLVVGEVDVVEEQNVDVEVVPFLNSRREWEFGRAPPVNEGDGRPHLGGQGPMAAATQL